MEHDLVRSIAKPLGNRSAIFGIGGGSAIDMAKFVAAEHNLPLVLLPSILSVDAAFTRAAAVREGSLVRYVKSVVPEHLLIDFGLLQQAPPLLNRAGAADVLSIFTALWDWREASVREGEFYDPPVAEQSRVLLDRLLSHASDIRDCSDQGLRLLAELFVGEVALCEQVGNSRPEEGSEHYLAYCVERLTGRSFIHGQLVGMCIDVVGRIQGQDVAPIRRFLKEAGLDCSLEAVGVTREELCKALTMMKDFVTGETHLLPGVFHFQPAMAGEEACRLVDDLR